MTNGTNYKRGNIHHSPWHSDIRTPNQLNRWCTPSLLDCMLQSKLSRYSQVHLQPHSEVCTQLHSIVHSQPNWLYATKYTLKREDTPNLTWLYASTYASACLIQRIGELQIAATRRTETGGIWRAVFRGQWVRGGVWHVGCGRWLVVYIGRNHDIGGYGSLNLISIPATLIRFHDTSMSWCWQFQPESLQKL